MACDSVNVVLVSLWKLKFLAYVVERNETFRYAYHFIRKCCVFHMYVTIAFGNGESVKKLLRPRVHGAAQRRKRKSLQVPK